jgi:hypothetical protein
MSRARRLVGPCIALALLALLAGCETRKPKPELTRPWPTEPPSTPAPKAVDLTQCPAPTITHISLVEDTLQKIAALRQMNAAQQKVAFDEAKREFATRGSDDARLRLATLYLLPGAAWRSDAIALQLLEPYAKPQPMPSAWRGYATALIAQIEESRRNDNNVRNQNARLKDEQAKSEALQRKLDALREAERAMILKDTKERPR